MNLEQKQNFVGGLKGDLEGAAALFQLDFTGLNVAATQDLRARCREAGITYRVMKNTLMKALLSVHLHVKRTGPH